jgi:hypothetical protein
MNKHICGLYDPDNDFFQEAIAHCRWKKVCRNFLKDINVSQYADSTFNEIFSSIYELSANVNGIGFLTIYDITEAICRHYNKKIEKVYIIGGGPRRAIKILNIRSKRQKINEKISLNYVDIADVIQAFSVKGYILDEVLKNNKNGDVIESYLCNWQKKIKGDY